MLQSSLNISQYWSTLWFASASADLGANFSLLKVSVSVSGEIFCKIWIRIGLDIFKAEVNVLYVKKFFHAFVEDKTHCVLGWGQDFALDKNVGFVPGRHLMFISWRKPDRFYSSWCWHLANRDLIKHLNSLKQLSKFLFLPVSPDLPVAGTTGCHLSCWTRIISIRTPILQALIFRLFNITKRPPRWFCPWNARCRLEAVWLGERGNKSPSWFLF